jgi:predicted MFS family arabinose efflux permease
MKILFFNKALRVLLWTNALILLASAMIGPIYAIFAEEVGGDLMDASIAGGIFALTAGIVTLISGKYSDKIKENELIISLGYLIEGLGFMLYIWVDSVATLFAVQVVIGLGEAIYNPAFDAVYSKHLDGHKSGTQWGAWESMYYFTRAIGAILGGVLVISFSFQAMFIVMGLLCFFSGLYIYFLKRSVL